jgi:hypothetical protein
VLLRLAYLGVTNALTLLRLLPMSDRAKDAEILALRHQIMILERQLHGQKIRFTPADRALLAALLHRLPRTVLRQIRLLVRPETVLRWHRDLIAARHARISRPKRVGRPPTVPVHPILEPHTPVWRTYRSSPAKGLTDAAGGTAGSAAATRHDLYIRRNARICPGTG